MNIDKPCYNSFCSRRLTERNAAILSSYNIYYKKRQIPLTARLPFSRFRLAEQFILHKTCGKG